MAIESPKNGAPGTTEQSPRWEGPEASRPRGYLPAKDDPEHDRDALGENLRDPTKRDVRMHSRRGSDVVSAYVRPAPSSATGIHPS
jgi:hypothetical protein